MFNHYSVRPVGSRRFEEHLNEVLRIGEERKEERQASVPVLPVILSADPTDMKSTYDPVAEGWKALETAIICQAVVDYLDEYEKKLLYEDRQSPRADVCESRCLILENEFFRIDEERSAILDSVLKYVIHNADDFGKLRYRLDRIYKVRKQIRKIIWQPIV